MRTRITLECTECKNRNYNMTKDKKAHPDRMETKKYCRFCKSHTLHKETKYSSGGSDIMSGNEKTQKKSWFKGLQAEFKKVIWPDKKTLAKQTTAVVAVSVVLGALIAVIDAILRYGIDLLVR